MPHTIFVYGTLLEGRSSHHLLLQAEYLGVFCLTGYALYDLGTYPGIVAHPNHKVLGECYSVDASTLAKLDHHEQEGVLYQRVPVTLSSTAVPTLQGEAYAYLKDTAPHRLVPITEQPWA